MADCEYVLHLDHIEPLYTQQPTPTWPPSPFEWPLPDMYLDPDAPGPVIFLDECWHQGENNTYCMGIGECDVPIIGFANVVGDLDPNPIERLVIYTQPDYPVDFTPTLPLPEPGLVPTLAVAIVVIALLRQWRRRRTTCP